LVELDRNKPIPITVKGSLFQSIQFIPNSKNNLDITYFLFFRDNGRIEMYYICTEKKKGYTLIKTQPELHTTIVESCLWYQWDPHRSLLYYIVPKNGIVPNGTNNATNGPKSSKGGLSLVDCVLKCCSFSNIERPKIIFESEQALALPN